LETENAVPDSDSVDNGAELEAVRQFGAALRMGDWNATICLVLKCKCSRSEHNLNNKQWAIRPSAIVNRRGNVSHTLHQSIRIGSSCPCLEFK